MHWNFHLESENSELPICWEIPPVWVSKLLTISSYQVIGPDFSKFAMEPPWCDSVWVNGFSQTIAVWQWVSLLLLLLLAHLRRCGGKEAVSHWASFYAPTIFISNISFNFSGNYGIKVATWRSTKQHDGAVGLLNVFTYSFILLFTSISWMCFKWVKTCQCRISICGLSESDATSILLPLWSRLWDTKHWYLPPSVYCMYHEIEPKPGIHTPNCLKKWTEEQEGLALNLRKAPPSPPPGSSNQVIDLRQPGLNLY